MPAHSQRNGPSHVPVSPRNHARYANKDGSKFIALPKGTLSDSSVPSTPTIPSTIVNEPSADAATLDGAQPPVNRKKQKRREKAAAKLAIQEAAAVAGATNARAGMGLNGAQVSSPSVTQDQGQKAWEEAAIDDTRPLAASTRYDSEQLNDEMLQGSKKKNKKKKKKNGGGAEVGHDFAEAPQSAHDKPDSTPQPHPSGISRDKIWSTSSHEERERIKEFWLGLGEDDRKSLVKVEKDAVLKKMKEQQRHTCSCTVCGRKRTAIEEELEGLYDAYYQELEQFANQGEAPPMLSPPGNFSSMRPPPQAPPTAYGHPPSRARIVEHVTEDDEEDGLDDEIFSEDEVDEYEDSENDEPPEADDLNDVQGGEVADFLTFGNSLQVKGTQLLESLLNKYGNKDLGGILTVADDLLKNDGKRFIDMMEQLAERRMAREEDAQDHFRGYGHPNGSYSHPHHHHHHHMSPEEEDEYDEDEEDDEEDYEDSQEEEYEDEEDQMTEEQRMEEGRRMFQIFAARMFEQRVLSAYKEKIAKERQERLLEELEEESRQVDQQKAKKAKNAQKKKDKAAQKKQAQVEEKARKDAEKAAEETARLEAEQKRAAEQRQKAEDKRKQRDAQKKAEEDARLKKEADKQRRLNEQREKQAEQERKAREAKEKEKKVKDEQRQKEKETRDRKEKEAQERKEKQDRDKREKEARAAKAAKDAQEAKEAKEAKTKEAKISKVNVLTSQSQVPSQPPKRVPSHQAPVSVPMILPQHPPNPSNKVASPDIPSSIPTGTGPKVSLPTRKASHHYQDTTQATSSSNSQAPSLPSQNASPHQDDPISRTSPATFQHRKASGGPPSIVPHSISPSVLSHGSPSMHMPPMHIQPPPGLVHHPPPPGFPNRKSHEAMFPPGLRHGPNMMMPPPGINAQSSRGFPPMPIPPPGFVGGAEHFPIGQGFPMPKDGPPAAHGRQGSASFEQSPIGMSQPIGRPAPIGRPTNGTHGPTAEHDDDLKQKHLGSRALIEDDEPLEPEGNVGSLRTQPPGPRAGFGGPGSFIDPGFPLVSGHNPWGPPAGASNPFPPTGFGNPAWAAPGAPPGFQIGSAPSSINPMRPAQPRHITVRWMLCQACRALAGTNSASKDGFVDLGAVKSQVDTLSAGDPYITEQDLLNLCDTEGSAVNGGGTFDIRRDVGGPGKHSIRWMPDLSDSIFQPVHRAVGAPGEIGSPLIGSASSKGI